MANQEKNDYSMPARVMLQEAVNADKLRSGGVQKERGKSDMCRAIEELIEDGKIEGKEEGKTEGRLEGDAARIVKSIESVMINLKVEAARACEIIGVTIEEYRRAREITALQCQP